MALAGLVVQGGASATSPAEATQKSKWAEADPGDEITFYYGLKRHEARADRTLARVSDPQHARYRQFPSVRRIGERFGATKDAKRVVQKSASSAGLSFALDRTGVFARISGSVAQMAGWLGTGILTTDQQGVRYYRADGSGEPDGLSKWIRESVSYYLAQVPGQTLLRTAAPWHQHAASGTWVRGCKEADNSQGLSYQQLQTAYGQLARPNDRRIGRRVHLAILENGSGYSDAALAHSAACFSSQGRIFSRAPVDGLEEPLPQSGEGDLDTQIAQSMVPRGSRVTVVEQLNTSGAGGSNALWFLMWSKLLELPDLPTAVTLSAGYCEEYIKRHVGAETFSLWDSVFARVGLAGVSAVAAAGDTGSTSCQRDDPKNKKLSVAAPASSPHITAVGGSHIALNPDNTRSDEVVWNDGRAGGAGAGGSSKVYDRPWYQDRAIGKGASRSVPDLSLNAAEGSSWPVAGCGPPHEECGFQQIWGTSAASPYFASQVAVMAAKQAISGRPPYGLLNPALYQSRAADPATFFDIVETNNSIFNKRCCEAPTGYDQASGLGAPNFRPLYRSFTDPGVPGNG